MSHFHLTLPSNSSMRFYPNNTKSHFITKLQGVYELQGDWEVGLSEMLFSKSWYNVKKEDSMSVLWEEKAYQVPITEGYYQDVVDLIREINKQTKSLFEIIERPSKYLEVVDEIISIAEPKFRFNKINNKVCIELHKDMSISLTNNLARLMGFTRHSGNIKGTGLLEIDTVEAPRASDLHAGLETIYVYCDILECVPVGDTKAPLLRIVDVSDERHCALLKRSYERPRYIPLQKKTFDSIEILLRTDSGEAVPFERGKVIVTLHFRRADGAYFL